MKTILFVALALIGFAAIPQQSEARGHRGEGRRGVVRKAFHRVAHPLENRRDRRAGRGCG